MLPLLWYHVALLLCDKAADLWSARLLMKDRRAASALQQHGIDLPCNAAACVPACAAMHMLLLHACSACSRVSCVHCTVQCNRRTGCKGPNIARTITLCRLQ